MRKIGAAHHLVGLLLRLVFVEELPLGVGDLAAGKHAATTGDTVKHCWDSSAPDVAWPSVDLLSASCSCPSPLVKSSDSDL